ncbi:MAG: hypothetical protein NZO16_04810 [Deltaproteobacteria bacterium]|nr:hypothetical protein [Deltaproteobacteria bacterium]
MLEVSSRNLLHAGGPLKSQTTIACVDYLGTRKPEDCCVIQQSPDGRRIYVGHIFNSDSLSSRKAQAPGKEVFFVGFLTKKKLQREGLEQKLRRGNSKQVSAAQKIEFIPVSGVVNLNEATIYQYLVPRGAKECNYNRELSPKSENLRAYAQILRLAAQSVGIRYHDSYRVLSEVPYETVLNSSPNPNGGIGIICSENCGFLIGKFNSHLNEAFRLLLRAYVKYLHGQDDCAKQIENWLNRRSDRICWGFKPRKFWEQRHLSAELRDSLVKLKLSLLVDMYQGFLDEGANSISTEGKPAALRLQLGQLSINNLILKVNDTVERVLNSWDGRTKLISFPNISC